MRCSHSRAFTVFMQRSIYGRSIRLLSTQCGSSALYSSVVFAFGRRSNRYRRCQYGSRPFALAVSMLLYSAALACAPSGVAANSQFFRPSTNGRMARSALPISCGKLCIDTQPPLFYILPSHALTKQVSIQQFKFSTGLICFLLTIRTQMKDVVYESSDQCGRFWMFCHY